MIEASNQGTQENLIEQTETLMQEKREADAKYQKTREEYQRLQEQLVGTSEQANQERAALTAKQEKLESERGELVRNYESEIESLRAQNQEY